MTTTALVLSDTHLAAGRRGTLPGGVYRLLEGADVILHAGDIVAVDVLRELSGWAPVHAVLGNNDLDPALSALPERRVEVLDDVRVGMVHDSGARTGRAGRLRRWFPDADVVVFGHSHVPCLERGIDAQLLVNPGSPTQRRAQPAHTVALLEFDAGRVTGSRIVEV